jgi:hypothetical protein
MDLGELIEWIAYRRKKEEAAIHTSASSSDRIDYPSSLDVLLGRGRPYFTHPGNARLAGFISQHRSRYQKLPRMEKTRLANDIVKSVKDSRGRFLKKDEIEHGWGEVSDDVAREKVSHMMRGSAKNAPIGAAALSFVDAPTVVESEYF